MIIVCEGDGTSEITDIDAQTGLVAPGFKGRIGYTCDGNASDADDWAASPISLAIIHAMGAQNRLVHFDYNSLLGNDHPPMRAEHDTSVLGAIDKYGYDPNIFFDDMWDLQGAVNNIASAIDASSADNPFYLIIAGGGEVAYQGIAASDPNKRQHVYCISHHWWNDFYGNTYTTDPLCNHEKKEIIALGVNWVQIGDQNSLLATAGGTGGVPLDDPSWIPYHWMRDSLDANLNWIYSRMEVLHRPDPSDAGMAYFLLTGDEKCDPLKLEKLLELGNVPAADEARRTVLLEAENFSRTYLDVEFNKNQGWSQEARVELPSTGMAGSISTVFNEPYSASGIYDVVVRYFNRVDPSRSAFSLLINDAEVASWTAREVTHSWKQKKIPDVQINKNDEIKIEVVGDGSELGAIDYVKLTSTAQSPYGGTPWPIEGTILAENYDEGGQDVAYSDATAGNSANGTFREDEDVDSNGVGVSRTTSGEWLEYTIDVAASGLYDIEVRSASNNSGRQIHIEIDGVDVTGLITLPDTNSGNLAFAEITPATTTEPLSPGQHVMRIYIDYGGFNLDYVRFTAQGSLPVAVDDTYVTNENSARVMDVLANDSDPDAGDVLAVDNLTQGTNGSVVNNGTDVTYTPDPGFTGPDSFTYTVTDGNGGFDTATVDITVNSANVDYAAYWKFDGNADDESTNNLHGTPEGDASWATGGALLLDGDGDKVTVTSDTLLDLTGDFTVTAWVWQDAACSTYGRIIGKSDGSSADGWVLSKQGANRLRIRLGNGGGKIYRTSDASIPEDDQHYDVWTFVAVTFDDTSNKLSLYVNATRKTYTLDEDQSNVAVNADNVVIGGMSSADHEWTGMIDETRVYNRALSETEIAAISGL